jgi:RNA polymerase sigma factor (sigma-70 family)
MDSSSVTTWLYNAAKGDSLSAQRLWERYLDRFIGLAAYRLRNSPKRLADEEDLVLTVFDEFLRKARQGIYPRLESREDFWQIVVQITERRAIDQRRRARAYEQHVSGESVLGLTDNSSQSDSPPLNLATSIEPSPDEAVAFAEELAMLLSRLPTDELRSVVQCRLAGMTDNEIAQRLRCSLRTVERRLNQIRRAWADRMPPGERTSLRWSASGTDATG